MLSKTKPKRRDVYQRQQEERHVRHFLRVPELTAGRRVAL